MKVVQFFYSLVLLLNFNCASTSNVVFDYNVNTDFSKFNTFVLCVDDLFVEHTNMPKMDNKLIRNYIADAVENEMKSLGHQTNVLNPQLQVGFIITLSETTNTFKDCNNFDDLTYWDNCVIQEKTYIQETLVVYVSDYQTQEIIWQASIECNLNKPKNILQIHIETLVADLFDTYPKKV